jgi:bacteriorhodopsin
MHSLLCDTSLGGLSLDFTANSPLQSVTLYLFLSATLAFGAAAAFFLLMRREVDPPYRTTMVLSTLICGIACFNYWLMTNVYRESGGTFPTALRYVDWLITTPLVLLTFPLLLRLGEAGRGFSVRLVVLDVAMIVTAFIAETAPINSERWWTFFLVSCVFEALIVGVLFVSLGQAIAEAPAPLAKALETMRLFVLIGWAIYPIGFLMARSGNGELREIIYNIADVINKVGFGLVAYHGIQAMGYGASRD